MFKKPL